MANIRVEPRRRLFRAIVLERRAAEGGRLVARVRELRPADWDRTAEHPEYSRYSVFILFRHLAMHDMLRSRCSCGSCP